VWQVKVSYHAGFDADWNLPVKLSVTIEGARSLARLGRSLVGRLRPEIERQLRLAAPAGEPADHPPVDRAPPGRFVRRAVRR
jgi:hypothetical protein